MQPDTRATVLVLDNNAEELMELVTALEDRYDFEDAPDGEVLIDRTAEIFPDIIILDDMTLSPNCYEVCQNIKSNPATRHIPIVIMSDLSATELESEVGLLGADDYICRPINTPELTEKIDTLLSFAVPLCG